MDSQANPKLKLAGDDTPRMPKAYIVGPMRGYPTLNFPAFDDATFFGRRAGFEVVSPAEIDRAMGLNPATFKGFGDNKAVRDCAHRDLSAILSLEAEKGDVIAILPGWERSSGAMMEVCTAMFLGLGLLDARTWEPMEDESLAGIDWRGMCARFQRTFKNYAEQINEKLRKAIEAQQPKQ